MFSTTSADCPTFDKFVLLNSTTRDSAICQLNEVNRSKISFVRQFAKGRNYTITIDFEQYQFFRRSRRN
ncbi:MAG: hypothetical protein LBB88_02060 [Planctomycetaceae bacterium]|nr:hypothetical protein [Planctomycetaceae bacterium]